MSNRVAGQSGGARLEHNVADLIYTANVSLDGFIEHNRGSFDLTTPDDDVFAYITGFEPSSGTYLYGRRMYGTMAVWEMALAWGRGGCERVVRHIGCRVHNRRLVGSCHPRPLRRT